MVFGVSSAKNIVWSCDEFVLPASVGFANSMQGSDASVVAAPSPEQAASAIKATTRIIRA
jgi:hypothetical protein